MLSSESSTPLSNERSSVLVSRLLRAVSGAINLGNGRLWSYDASRVRSFSPLELVDAQFGSASGTDALQNFNTRRQSAVTTDFSLTLVTGAASLESQLS